MPTYRVVDERIFECQICLSLPEGTINQCRRGHMFCSGCYKRHCDSCKTCPTCRTILPIEPIRNLVAEQTVASFPARCPRCKKTMPRGELCDHPCPPLELVACSAPGAGCDDISQLAHRGMQSKSPERVASSMNASRVRISIAVDGSRLGASTLPASVACRLNTPLERVFLVYCHEQQLDMSNLAFLYQGQVLSKNRTPADYTMMDGDIVVVQDVNAPHHLPPLRRSLSKAGATIQRLTRLIGAQQPGAHLLPHTA